jgi:hypothetical protein
MSFIYPRISIKVCTKYCMDVHILKSHLLCILSSKLTGYLVFNTGPGWAWVFKNLARKLLGVITVLTDRAYIE